MSELHVIIEGIKEPNVYFKHLSYSDSAEWAVAHLDLSKGINIFEVKTFQHKLGIFIKSNNLKHIPKGVFNQPIVGDNGAFYSFIDQDQASKEYFKVIRMSRYIILTLSNIHTTVGKSIDFVLYTEPIKGTVKISNVTIFLNTHSNMTDILISSETFNGSSLRNVDIIDGQLTLNGSLILFKFNEDTEDMKQIIN